MKQKGVHELDMCIDRLLKLWLSDSIASDSYNELVQAMELMDNANSNKIVWRENYNKQAKIHFFLFTTISNHLTNSTLTLIEHLDNKEITNGYGNTPMMTAVGSGHIEIVKKLLALKVCLTTKNIEDNTALELASVSERVEIMQILLDAGAPIEQQANLGRTALVSSVNHYKLKSVRFLLDHKAHPMKQDVYEQTAVHHAAVHNCTILWDMIMKHPDASVFTTDRIKQTPLFQAAGTGSLKIVKRIIEDFKVTLSYIDAKDIYGSSAIHYAANHGHKNTMEYLIEKGADVNIINKNQLSLLDMIMASDSDVQTKNDLVSLLASKKANFNWSYKNAIMLKEIDLSNLVLYEQTKDESNDELNIDSIDLMG